MKFSELKIELSALGFITDEIGIERRLVEGYVCRDCRVNLIYKGYRSADETRCYGVCGKCGSVRKFYFNSPVIAAGKRRFSKARG